jgi:hypothetical protein
MTPEHYRNRSAFFGGAMRRRTVLASGLTVLTALSIPGRQVFATGTAEVPAIGLDGRPLLLRGGEIDDLRAGVRGDVLTADQSDWDTARRLWNPAFDKKPALIVRCLGAADVRRAVRFAGGHGLLTAVRGGGHSLSGQSACDGGIMIDLSPMRSVEVDPSEKTARVQGGALLGQLDRESLAFNLATPVGTTSSGPK